MHSLMLNKANTNPTPDVSSVLPTVSKPLAAMPPSACSLLHVAKQQRVVIEDIVANTSFGAADAVVSQRLKDLGFLPNATARVVAKGLFGVPPFVVQLASGVQFSLRTEELKKIRCAPAA